jgi:hypothetical protein
LADLFDKDKVAELTARLCQHCGNQLARRDYVEQCEKMYGTPMSPTWIKAFRERQ